MQDLARSSYDGCYVHKLRSEKRDGADVHVGDAAPESQPKQRTSWIIAKLIGASLAVASLLVLAAREFVLS